MKLVAAALFRWKHEDPSISKPVMLAGAFDLKEFSYFQRGPYEVVAAVVDSSG
jgi:hypothetical protein